jgi:hypothetical protein
MRFNVSAQMSRAAALDSVHRQALELIADGSMTVNQARALRAVLLATPGNFLSFSAVGNASEMAISISGMSIAPHQQDLHELFRVR